MVSNSLTKTTSQGVEHHQRAMSEPEQYTNIRRTISTLTWSFHPAPNHNRCYDKSMGLKNGSQLPLGSTPKLEDSTPQGFEKYHPRRTTVKPNSNAFLSTGGKSHPKRSATTLRHITIEESRLRTWK